MRKFGLAFAATLLSLAFSAAQGGVLISVVKVPKSGNTTAYGINDNNIIVGSWIDKKEVEHGFFGTLDGQYTTFDYIAKHVTRTIPAHINNAGNIVGLAFFSGSPCFDGFMFLRRKNGQIVTITKNGQPVTGDMSGLNSDNVSVGGIDVSGCTRKGFQATNGVFDKTLNLAPATRLTPTGINDNGIVIGYFFSSDDLTDHSFRLQHGVMTQIDYPAKGANNTHLVDVNDKNIAIGSYQDDGGFAHGFELDLKTNTFTPFNPSGETEAEPTGINNAGFVAMTVEEGGGAFIYCPLKASKCPGKGKHMSMGTPVRAAPGSVLHFAAPRLTSGFGSH